MILGIGDWGLGIGDWGLGIGDWESNLEILKENINKPNNKQINYYTKILIFV